MDKSLDKDYRTFVSFIKAFKEAIPNFDETKIFFEKKSKPYKGLNVLFVQDKLKKLHLYCSYYYIWLWKDHFIEFLNTGTFDNYCYWKVFVNGNVLEYRKFITESRYGTDYNPHSNEVNDYLNWLRDTHGKDSGLEHIPKSEYLKWIEQLENEK